MTVYNIITMCCLFLFTRCVYYSVIDMVVMTQTLCAHTYICVQQIALSYFKERNVRVYIYIHCHLFGLLQI